MEKKRSAFLKSVFSLCLALAGCETTGTSTDTPNTLTGVVLTAEGNPAARAVVTARSNQLRKNPAGENAWEILGQTVADGQGRFYLQVHAEGDVYLEAEDGASAGIPPGLFFRHYAAHEPALLGGVLGNLTLAPAGVLQGRIVDTALHTFSSLQVGVVGLPVFSGTGAPDSAGGFSFRLPDVPAGLLELKAIVILDNSSGRQIPYADKLPEAETKSGAVVDMGVITFLPK